MTPTKTILQPIERGVDFVGHLIKPWRRSTRPRTVNEALRRTAAAAPADVHQLANSYWVIGITCGNHDDEL
ncbi:hypothetical protein [Paraburkholderia bryophila]|uniref:Uncharacterized protein n=1 Tax=Paraburkholderia bryophila TaxID=420952 RepID=A0A7Z0B4Z3_9BURK|nr:hypothetical protein [Paraburkholderia bryophila]NYH21424.1 hypothetical protein [Paraburkholderia bryophila]